MINFWNQRVPLKETTNRKKTTIWMIYILRLTMEKCDECKPVRVSWVRWNKFSGLLIKLNYALIFGCIELILCGNTNSIIGPQLSILSIIHGNKTYRLLKPVFKPFNTKNKPNLNVEIWIENHFKRIENCMQKSFF